MRLQVILFLAAAALQCQAATLPDIKTPTQTITDAKNTQDDVKLIKDEKEEPLQNNASEEELIQPVNTVPEIGNELRTQKVDKIPVKIVPEGKPTLKSDTTEKVAENEIKNEKPQEDSIKPEVQKVEKPEDDKKEDHKPNISDISDFDDEVEEPESQNDEPNLSLALITEALCTAHQSVQLTVDTFAKAFQTWVKDQSALLPSEEQIKTIIDNNIKKINETLTGYFSPAQAAKLVEVDSTNHVEVVESDLKKLENDFEKDAKLVLATERADNGTSGSGSAPGGGIGGGPAIFQNFQQVVQQGFSNISNTFSNLFNQGGTENSTNNLFALFGQNFGNFFNQPSGSTQSDESATSRPTIFQSIQNIFRPPFQQIQSQLPQSNQPQSDQPQADQSQPNRPIINAIQGNPIVQTISGVFNRNPTKEPTPITSEPAKPAEEGSNIVPEKPEPSADPAEESPEKEKPEPTPELQVNGPIQQAIQKNPIVQGIAGAVQKIQNTISNPEKPRKIGHLIHHHHHGIHHHGGHGGYHGENGNKFFVDVDHFDSAGAPGPIGSIGSDGATELNEKKPDSEKKADCEKKENPAKTDETKLADESKKVEQKSE